MQGQGAEAGEPAHALGCVHVKRYALVLERVLVRRVRYCLRSHSCPWRQRIGAGSWMKVVEGEGGARERVGVHVPVPVPAVHHVPVPARVCVQVVACWGEADVVH